MAKLAIAMDLGSSGFRGQAIDLSNNEVIATAISTRHPLPGGNIIDHVHFALELGIKTASNIIIAAVNRIISALGISTNHVVRLAICGNPVQLSLFQRLEVRDLAYAGKHKLKTLKITAPDRGASILTADDILHLDLPPECEVLIPPAVKHEVGADALALIIQSGLMEQDTTSIAIDFGTNAEMAIFHNNRVYTGSTSAGPALEGQHISCGMLAAPGAIVDINQEPPHHRLIQLDDKMLQIPQNLIDLRSGNIIEKENTHQPLGVTGTGTIAALHQALNCGLIRLPAITTQDSILHLGSDISLCEKDIIETGKAIGALRAGYITLSQYAELPLSCIRTAYLSGASGTYVDAQKALNLGMIPPRVETIHQLGNTSLAMAKEIAIDPETLSRMEALANKIRDTHCVFASSAAFKKLYLLEFSHWTEGMPLSDYRRYLQRYGLPELPATRGKANIVRKVSRDIEILGRKGLAIVSTIGNHVELAVQGCTRCRECEKNCPGRALSVNSKSTPPKISLRQAHCHGVTCRYCERSCSAQVFNLDHFFEHESNGKNR